MRRIAVLMAAFLFVAPAIPLGADLTDFEGGQKEVVVDLKAPGFEATANIAVPAGFWAANATMKVTGMAAEGNSSDYPENVVMKINDTTIWAFQQMGSGPLGMQDRFVGDAKQVQLQFKPGGGSSKTTIRLPKSATVESAVMEIKALPSSNGQEIVNLTGETKGDWFGISVSSAGDVNGDGYDDVVVGASFFRSAGVPLGKAFVFFGGPNMDSNADVTLSEAVVGYEEFGNSVSGAGDVNNDGFDDVIVGSYLNDSGGEKAGRAYLYFGGPHMDSTADVILTGTAEGDKFGISVSDAGDVNKDGYDDVIVGACYNDTGGSNAGRAYIYFGGKNMDNLPDVNLTGDTDNYGMGYSVSGAGDVNGDGYDDVIVGGKKKTIYLGGANVDNKSDVMPSLTDGYVSNAGDVNNDGYDDVFISEINIPTALNYIYYGSQIMDITPDVVINTSGCKVSGAGDVNNDGYDDVLLGSESNNTGGTYAGQAYVFLGGQNVDTCTDLTITGIEHSGLGYSLSDAGDVNKDGYDDIIVGAPDYQYCDKIGWACIYTFCEGILNPGVAIGSKSLWQGTGYFNMSVLLSDFADEINAYLRSAPVTGYDSYGNAFVDVPVNVNSSGNGTLLLSKLNIAYSYDAVVPDFSSALNDYLAAHKNDTNPDRTVPVNVHSLTAGRIKLFNLNFSRDLPPSLVGEIATAVLDEDSWNLTLIDLYPHFQDDVGSDTNLTFSVVSSTNSSIVRLFITGGRYLSADAMTSDENDNWTGTVEAVIACADRWGQKVESNIFTIVVKNVNDPPVITSSPIRDAEAGVPYSYPVTAVDGDRDRLVFSLSTAPANMTIDADTGKIQWMPRTGGDHPVTFSVSDGQASSEQSFPIHVPNRAPRITSEPPLNATTGAMYIYNVIAVDDNQDPLTYSLGMNIDGMSVGNTNGTITWVPAKVGEYHVVVQVSDGKLKAEQKFDITVVQGNRAPRFTSKAVTAAIVGIPYEYAAKASDEDGDVLGFSLVAGPEGMELDNGTGKITWMPVSAGNFTVNIRVTDGREGETFQEFVIRVADVILPSVTVTFPSEGQKVKGAVELRGTTTKGTREVVRVEVKVDSGDWQPAVGTVVWSYQLDTETLAKGFHTLAVRAYDGAGCSDVAIVNFEVEKPITAQAQETPSMLLGAVVLVILVVAIGAIIGMRKRPGRGGGSE